jgi:hypothetical protein
MWGLAAAAAWAGYGDAVGDVPTVRGRQLVLWIDAARVAPDAFQADYLAGGCSFASFPPAEQVPQVPYRWDAGLAQAAYDHSLDMSDSGLFQHDSSDGTPWSDRVWAAYAGGAIAENIAWGYASARSTVLRTWMCSSAGHRSAILSPTYEDVAGDMVGTYATADFGEGVGGGFPAVSMGAHEPASPGGAVYFLATWSDAGPPDTFEVIADGAAVPLSLTYGADDVGVYAATGLPVDASPCHAYWFRATRAGVETRFPETGSYTFGTCAGANPATGFLSGQVGPLTNAADTVDWTRGATVTVTVTGAVPGQSVALGAGTRRAAGPCPAVIGGACLDVAGSLRSLGSATADGAGTARIAFVVPAGLPAGLSVWSQVAAADGHGNWVVGPVQAATIR